MQINGRTKVCGIMGSPVSHSLSPAMHNAAFQAARKNMVYVPLPVNDVEAALKGFRASGIHGVSVTIPYKESVIPFLDEIDPVARNIGAVNTLKIEEGRITGFNTDWQGANRALEKAMPLANSSILLLGAGGSAKAIGFGLLEAGAKIMLASRTPAKGQSLAKLLNCPWHPWDKVAELHADALVNATSVGMTPNSDASPVGREILDQFPVVMDIVYAPLKTKLLIEAEAVGSKTVNGLAMLLYQGMAQFEIWTGMEAPEAVMRDALLNGLQG